MMLSIYTHMHTANMNQAFFLQGEGTLGSNILICPDACRVMGHLAKVLQEEHWYKRYFDTTHVTLRGSPSCRAALSLATSGRKYFCGYSQNYSVSLWSQLEHQSCGVPWRAEAALQDPQSVPAPGSRQIHEGGGEHTAFGLRETGWGAATKVTDHALELCPSSSNNIWTSKTCLSRRSLHKGTVRWKHVGDGFVLSLWTWSWHPIDPISLRHILTGTIEHIGRNHPRHCSLSCPSTGLEAPVCGWPISSTAAIRLCLCPHLNREEPVLGTPLEAHFKTQYNEFSLFHTIDPSLLSMCCCNSREWCWPSRCYVK